jgi:hypothetical protein
MRVTCPTRLIRALLVAVIFGKGTIYEVPGCNIEFTLIVIEKKDCSV